MSHSDSRCNLRKIDDGTRYTLNIELREREKPTGYESRGGGGGWALLKGGMLRGLVLYVVVWILLGIIMNT